MPFLKGFVDFQFHMEFASQSNLVFRVHVVQLPIRGAEPSFLPDRQEDKKGTQKNIYKFNMLYIFFIEDRYWRACEIQCVLDTSGLSRTSVQPRENAVRTTHRTPNMKKVT